ncbi:MAG: hypothetical protein AAFN09_05750 [Pseudomonadota bacterium]
MTRPLRADEGELSLRRAVACGLRGALLAIAAIGALPLAADTPLRPAEPWTAQFDGQILVIGDPSQPQIVIAPPTGPAWAIPVWRDPGGVLPSPDGRHALLRNTGLNLLSLRIQPNDIVLRVVAETGEATAEIPLASLMDSAQLTQTASHFVWIDTFRWEAGAWLFATPDGQLWSLRAEDGELTRQ